MNLKLRAAAITAGVVGSGMAAGFALSYFPNWVALLIAVSFVLYLVYSTALAGLKFDQSVDKMNAKFTDK